MEIQRAGKLRAAKNSRLRAMDWLLGASLKGGR